MLRMGKNSGPKFMNFFDGVGDPLNFPTPFPDCLYVIIIACSPGHGAGHISEDTWRHVHQQTFDE